MASGNGVLSKFKERLWRIRMARSSKNKNKDKDSDDRIKDFVIVRRGIADNRKVKNNKPDNHVRINVPKRIIIDDNKKRVGINDRINPPRDNEIKVNDKDNKIVNLVKEDKKDIKDGTDVRVVISKGILLNDDKDKVEVEEKPIVKGVENNKKINANNNSDIREKNESFDEDKKDNNLLGRNKEIIGFDRDEEKEERLERLEDELLDKIRDSLKDKLDELEVLEGELYLISVEKDNAIVKEKIVNVKRKIDDFIEEITKIVDFHNAYKRNYFIDNVLPIEDESIVDDLINYRTLVNSLGDEKEFVKKYKRFVELTLLYDKLVKMKDEVDKIQEETDEKTNNIENRDNKYKETVSKILKDIDINNSCGEEIDRQNSYFDDLMSKINTINREEYTTYHLRGIDELLGMSLRYVGLMMLSPLGGIIPGIAMQTMLTGRLVRNARDRLHLEAVNHVRYDAINYDDELSKKLIDINYASVLLDDTINDIKNLKEDFIRIYDSNIPGYEATMDKINKLEDIIVSNQNKILKIKDRIGKSREINNEKLVRVREMNNSN